METQHENSAADAHMQVAEKLDPYKVQGSVQKALDDIQDISRGSREKIGDETDGKSHPSESEMEQAVERARDANSKEKSRQAEQQSDWRNSLSCVVNDLVAFGRPFLSLSNGFRHEIREPFSAPCETFVVSQFLRIMYDCAACYFLWNEKVR